MYYLKILMYLSLYNESFVFLFPRSHTPKLWKEERSWTIANMFPPDCFITCRWHRAGRLKVNMNAEEISRREKHSRCVALEEDYVHQVYEKIGKDLIHAKDPLAEKVQNFLDDLEPGSLVADIGKLIL